MSTDMDYIRISTHILVLATVLAMAPRLTVSDEDKRVTEAKVCVNLYPSDDDCESWAVFGECYSNRDWMEQNCRYSCGFCDVDQSRETTSTPSGEYTHAPAANRNLPPPQGAASDPEHILVNTTFNSTGDVLRSSERKERDRPFSSSSSSSSATKPTSLWRISNRTTTSWLSIFYNHLSASTGAMEGGYGADATEEPHFELETTGASRLGDSASDVRVNDSLTSLSNEEIPSVPSGQGTTSAGVKENSSIIAGVWNTSLSVDFVEVTTTPSRQGTSAYEQMTSEQSDGMELTVLPDGIPSVRNKSRENPEEVPNALKRTKEVSSVVKSTTGAMEREATTAVRTMDNVADEDMTKRIQQTSNDTSQSTLNLPITSESLEMTTTGRQIRDEVSTNDTYMESSAERTTASDTKTSANVTSPALKLTEGGVAGGDVTNVTTMSSVSTTTEARCVNRWDIDTGSLDCEGWAAIGECEKNSIWMWQYCQKACQKCRSSDEETSGNTTSVQCDEGQFRCLDKRQCIDGAKICDGITDCEDISDEDDTICKVTFTCLESQYQCVDGLCISRQSLCDGQIDCTSSEDEDITLCQSITTMTDLKTSLINTDEITLSWTPSYNNHQLITGYLVSYHKVDDPANTMTFTYDSSVNLVTFYELKPDTEYVFTVKPIVLYFDAKGTTITARTSPVVCVNMYTEDPTMCDIWARAGECEKNPWWMSHYCARSCKVCLPDSTAGHTTHSTTVGSAVGSTAGEFTRNVTPTRAEAAVSQTTAASSPPLFTDTTAVQSAARSSEKAAVPSSTTAVPSTVESVTTGDGMEEQITFLYSTAVPPPAAAPITAGSDSGTTSTAVNMSGPVTVGSRSVQPTTAGHPPGATTAGSVSLEPTAAAHTAGSGSVQPTTAGDTAGEDITGYEHTESKRDVGSTKEPTQSGDALLIYAEALDGSIVVIDPRQTKSKKTIGESQKPVAIGYDPVTQTVFWSDVLEHRIYKKSLVDDGDAEVLLNVEDGLGITEGMAIDSYNQRLYFSHYYTQVVDTITLKWHSIDVLDLINGSRHTVVSDADSPRGLWVDSWNGFLFYTDVGAGKVVRCNLDGSDSFIIKSGLLSPNGVVYDGRVVYVIDSNYGGAELGGLYKTDINGNNWQKVTSGIDELKVPFAMTLGDNVLYITEWETHSIITYDTMSERSSVFSIAYLPMGITYSVLKQDRTDDVRCEESKCEGLCLHGEDKKAACFCPSYGVDVLQADGTSCRKPKSYMLVADANTVKMLTFASDDLTVHTVIQGDLLTLYSALIVTKDGTVYFTDTNRQIIYMTVLQDGATVQELFRAYHYIDGLAYNPATSTLYWTTYGDGSIMQLNVNSLTYNVTLSGLEKPRDIVTDVVNGYIYWTELGVTPKVMRSYLNGSKKEALLTSPLSNPNGLYLDQGTETLYILDSYNMMNKTNVYFCENINTSEVSCQELVSIRTADLLYGIYVYRNVLYFSDWTMPSVRYYDRTSETFGIVSSQFIRPTQLAVYGDVPDHCTDAPCSDICVSLLHTFTCLCSDDHGPLLADGWTCTKDAKVRVTVAMTTAATHLGDTDVTTPQPLITGEFQNTTLSKPPSTSHGSTLSHGMIYQNFTPSALHPKDMETTEMIQFLNSTWTSKMQGIETGSTKASEYPGVYNTTRTTGALEVPKAGNTSNAAEQSTLTRTPILNETTVAMESQEVTTSAETIEFITHSVVVQTETTKTHRVTSTLKIPKMPESSTVEETMKVTELIEIPETSVAQELTATPETSVAPNITLKKETYTTQITTLTPETSLVTKQITESEMLKPTVAPETSVVQSFTVIPETSATKKHSSSPETSLITKLSTTLGRQNMSQQTVIPETSTVPGLTMPAETSEMFETVEWVDTVLPETWTPSEMSKASVMTTRPDVSGVRNTHEMSATPTMTKSIESSKSQEILETTSIKRGKETLETSEKRLVTRAMETPTISQETHTGTLAETTENRSVISTSSSSTNIAATAASAVTATATTATTTTGSSTTNSNSSTKTTIASTTTTTTSVPAPVTTMTAMMTSGSPAVIVHITDNTRVVAGLNVTLTCEVKGIPQPTVSWFKVLPSGERMVLPSNESRISLPTYNMLNIRDTRKTDSGIYACVAGNLYGYTENLTEVIVLDPTVIIEKPQDVTTVRGTEFVMFNCVVSHDPSIMVTTSWYHKENVINASTMTDFVVYENGSLVVISVMREHAGSYSCHATSEIGDDEAVATLTVQEEPDKPTLVSVLPNKNDSFAVDLMWTPGDDHHSAIIAYIIEQRVVERGVMYGAEDGWVKVANVSDMTTTYTVTGLNTYTYYEFRVKAQNGVGLSKPSSENFGYLTPELPPSDAPSHVMASVETMDSLYVTWDQLPYTAHNGLLLGYIVRYKETGEDDSKFRYKNTTDSDAAGIQISGLKPYQRYHVSVAAYNSQGRGPFSEAVTLMTKEGVPSGSVQQVEVFAVNSTAVQVSWLPLDPMTAHGVIRGYKVQFHRIGGTRYQKVLVPAQGMSGNKHQVTVPGLEPTGVYEITIVAYTVKGDGPSSNSMRVVLPASASSTATEITSTATKTTTAKTASATTAISSTSTSSSVHPGTTTNFTELPAQPVATATTAEVRTATTAGVTITTTTGVTTTKRAPGGVITENMDTGPVWITKEEEVSTLTPGKLTTKYPTFPPKFVYCPEDQLVTVSSGSDPTVWWREPIVQDYYGNPVRLSSNYEPGSRFKVGSTLVIYIAIDRRGVNATCMFKVTVETQGFTCTGVPQLVNGYMKCGRVNYIYTCHAQCNTGYQVAAPYSGTHQCLTTGWTPDYKLGFASMACIKSERIMNKTSIVLTFTGSCPSDMDSFKISFLQQIESRLRQKNLCDNEDTNIIERYTCNRFNYQLTCGNTQALRQKRATDQLNLEMPVFIPSQNMTPEATRQINRRMRELEELFLASPSVTVDDTSVSFSKVTLTQDGLTCPTGWLNKGYKCEQCPAGTYLDVSSEQCQLCAAGSYQDQEAQLSCKQCPDGKTSAVGIFTDKQCYTPKPSTSAPVPGSDSTITGIDRTTVIIVVIAVIGGVLLLTAMIVAGVAVRNTCQRRRTLNFEKQNRQHLIPARLAREDGYSYGMFYPHGYITRKQQSMNGKEYPQQYTNIAYGGAAPVKQTANGKRPSAKVVRAPSSSSQISQGSTVVLPTRRNQMAYNAEVSVNLNSHSGQSLPTQLPAKSMNGKQPGVLTSRGTEVRAYSPGAGQPLSSAILSSDGNVICQASPSTSSSDGPHHPVPVIPAQPIMPGNLPPGQYRKLPSGQIIRLVPIKKPVKKNTHSKRYEMKRAVTKRPGPAGTVPHQGVFKKNVPITAVSGYGTYPPRPARIVATAQGGKIVSSSSVRTQRDHGWNALTLLDKTST